MFTIQVEVDDQIAVREGDFIGWYNNDKPMVGYSKQRSGLGVLIQSSKNPVDVGATIDWAGVDASEPRDYALQAVVTKGLKPQFKNLDTEISIYNNAEPGSDLYQMSFEETDGVKVPTQFMVFLHSFSEYFAYNQSINSVYVSTAPTQGKYTLEFTVRDHCGNEDTGKLKVTVEQKLPSISNLPAAVAVREDIRNTEVMVYELNVVHSSAVACHLKSSDPPEGREQFLVRTENGSMPRLFLKSTAELSYELADEYELSIRCLSGKESDMSSLIVNIIPNSVPTISNLPANVTLNANTSTIGDIIYTLSASDAENDPMTFNVTCDQTLCPFSVNEHGAVVISEDLRLSAKPTFLLKLSVEDSFNRAKPEVLLVNLTGLNTPPYIFNIPHSLKLPMEENMPIGTEIFHVLAADQNPEDVLRFSMTLKPTTMAAFFAIDEFTGLINVTEPTNFETLPSKNVKFSIYVTDGIHTYDTSFKVTVVDINEPPYFQYGNYTVLTDEGREGRVIAKGIIKAIEEDKGDEFLYSIDCGRETSLLQINEKSGDITQKYELDVDRKELAKWTIDCMVYASDKAGLKSNASLKIIVSDEDDNDPAFLRTSYLFVATRDLPVFSVIGTALADDLDTAPENQNLFYSFTDDTDDFIIDDNGRIYVVTSLAHNKIGTLFKLTLNVEDGHGPKDSVPLTIVVLSGNHTSLVTSLLVDKKTFFDLPENIAWFVTAIYLLVVMLSLLTYVCGRSFKCTVKLRSWDERHHSVTPSIWNDLDKNGVRASVISASPANRTSSTMNHELFSPDKLSPSKNNTPIPHIQNNIDQLSMDAVSMLRPIDTPYRRHSLSSIKSMSSEELPPTPLPPSRLSLSDIHTTTKEPAPLSPWKPWSISDFKNLYRKRKSEEWNGKNKVVFSPKSLANRRKSLNF